MEELDLRMIGRIISIIPLSTTRFNSTLHFEVLVVVIIALLIANLGFRFRD